jgi:hypothetical protein
MSINMTTNVRWKIVLNATSVKWHEQRHDEYMADQAGMTVEDYIQNG